LIASTPLNDSAADSGSTHHIDQQIIYFLIVRGSTQVGRFGRSNSCWTLRQTADSISVHCTAPQPTASPQDIGGRIGQQQPRSPGTTAGTSYDHQQRGIPSPVTLYVSHNGEPLLCLETDTEYPFNVALFVLIGASTSSSSCLEYGRPPWPCTAASWPSFCAVLLWSRRRYD
jgi:hypothetical protein